MPKLESIRAMKRILDELEVAETSSTAAAENHAEKIDRLEHQVSDLRNANVILLARVGEVTGDLGGENAKALRAGVMAAFFSSVNNRNAILWLKSMGWGEGGNGHYTDPITRDTFSLANAMRMQCERDLTPFKSLVNL